MSAPSTQIIDEEEQPVMHTKEELEAMYRHCSIRPIMRTWDWLEPIEELTYLRNMVRNKHEKAVQGAHLDSTLELDMWLRSFMDLFSGIFTQACAANDYLRAPSFSSETQSRIKGLNDELVQTFREQIRQHYDDILREIESGASRELEAILRRNASGLSGMAMYMLMAHQGDKEGKKSFVAAPIILVGSAGGVFGGLVMEYFQPNVYGAIVGGILGTIVAADIAVIAIISAVFMYHETKAAASTGGQPEEQAIAVRRQDIQNGGGAEPSRINSKEMELICRGVPLPSRDPSDPALYEASLDILLEKTAGLASAYKKQDVRKTQKWVPGNDFEIWASIVKAPYAPVNVSIRPPWTQPEELARYPPANMMSDRRLETGLSMIVRRGAGLA
eukprot:m51a1_g10608 hypothetical protein (388) ;mRNA; f:41934-43428